MKNYLLLFVCLINLNFLFAQDYASKSAELQKEIWGSPSAEFKVTAVPANFDNESAVIIAVSYSSQRSSNGRFKFLVLGAEIALHTQRVNTLHERIKINDKVALEAYSSLEYQKILDKTTSFLTARYKNTHNTFIGAKIIKPDGKEVIVNTGEEVLTKNERNDQQGKLAISGLQVGDILDYYITNIEVNETGDNSSYKDNDNVFVLADEYPILFYSIDFQFNKKLNVRHIYANGAPHFEESRNTDGDLLLSLKLHNLPKFQAQLWTSALRQYPYIEVGSAYKDELDKMIEKEKFDELTAMFQAHKMAFEDNFIENFVDFGAVVKELKNSFGSNKAFKNAPVDTVMKALYNLWKFKTFCFYAKDDFDDVSSINFRSAISRNNATQLCFILNDLEINYDLLLVSSRNSNTLDNVFNDNDFDAMIRINGSKPMYMCFDDAVTHFNQIPARFQGEKVIVLHPKRKSSVKYTFTESEDILPVTTADENYIDYHQDISFVQPDMRKIKISRIVKLGGALNGEDQKSLLSTSEIDNSITKSAKSDGPEKRFKREPNRVKYLNGLQSSVDKATSELDKKFSSEISSTFDVDPQQLSNCKIDNTGLDDSDPVLQFSETFVLDNLVKKAGNNYIIDAGKFTGNFIKLEEKDKKRNIDVYMPEARTFKYTINLTLPAGFNVKGLEGLNVQKSNKTGSFTALAALNGNSITLTVTRVYNHNFEKAADWPLLVAIIDTASDFNSKKILLEKKG